MTGSNDEAAFTLDNVNTFTDATVVNGQTYRYSVNAVNIMGGGRYSDEVEVTPYKPIFVPDIVGDLNAVTKKGKVTVSWTPPGDDGGSPLTGYIILRGETPDEMTEVGQVGLLTSYVDDDVEEGKTYYYTVKAVNDVGPGDSVVPKQVKVPESVTDEDEFPWVVLIAVIAVVGVVVVVRFVRPTLRKD